MKHQFLTNKEDIIAWLALYNIKDYALIENEKYGFVVKCLSNEDVDLSDKKFDFIPVKFNEVQGKFICSKNELTSLEFSPKYSNGFDCSHNKLQSLEGAPEAIMGSFDCSHNEITSLKQAPKFFVDFRHMDYNCSNNKLKSLEGAPVAVGGAFDCSNNELVSLEHAPLRVEDFLAQNNNLTNLLGAPKSTNKFNASNNQLVSIEGAPEHVKWDFDVSHNQLQNLIGSPTYVYSHYFCSHNRLTSLKGLEKLRIKDAGFDCSFNQLVNLEGFPQTKSIAKGAPRPFNCSNNPLTSLKGSPPTIDGPFDCSHTLISSFTGGPSLITELKANDCRLSSLVSLPKSIKDSYDSRPKDAEIDISNNALLMGAQNIKSLDELHVYKKERQGVTREANKLDKNISKVKKIKNNKLKSTSKI